MSRKCDKCGDNIFDSNAYLKISIMEREQQEKVDNLTNELKLLKEKYGKKSEEVIVVQQMLNIEKRILNVIFRCKNSLY